MGCTKHALCFSSYSRRLQFDIICQLSQTDSMIHEVLRQVLQYRSKLCSLLQQGPFLYSRVFQIGVKASLSSPGHCFQVGHKEQI